MRKSNSDYIVQIAQNTHESLKWLWTIVMAGAALQASFKLSSSFEFISPFKLDGPYLTHLYISSNFFVFFLTFFRFFWGDNKLMNYKYFDTIQFIKSRMDEKTDGTYDESFRTALMNISRRDVAIDVFIIFHKSVIFIYLARNIDNNYNFYTGYAVLLFTNIIWLFISYICSANKGEEAIVQALEAEFQAECEVHDNPTIDAKEILDRIKPTIAVKWWILNNTICLFLMILCMFLYKDLGQAENEVRFFGLFLVICLGNCVVDIQLTRKFYVQNVRKIFDVLSQGAN